jgi:hypothetical protein
MNIIIIIKRNLKENAIFGDDIYINNFIHVLKSLNYNVKVVGENSMYWGNYDVVHLHNVSFSQYGKRFKKSGSRVFAHIYFFWNAESNIISNFAGLFGNFLNQFYVDRYVVTSPILFKKLLKIGIRAEKLYLLSPYYFCPYCKHLDNVKIFEDKARELENQIKIVYIGTLSPNRVPLIEILKEIKKISKAIKVSFTIYTGNYNRTISSELYKNLLYISKNLEFQVISQTLSLMDKHRIFLRNHFFLFVPRSNVTMEPSMSLLEAIYHFTIPIVSKQLSGSELLPRINVLNNLTRLAPTILSIRHSIIRNEYPINELLKGFSKFYDKKRFINEIKNLYERNRSV